MLRDWFASPNRHGHTSVVKYLVLERGLSPNPREGNLGLSPLHFAANNGLVLPPVSLSLSIDLYGFCPSSPEQAPSSLLARKASCAARAAASSSILSDALLRLAHRDDEKEACAREGGAMADTATWLTPQHQQRRARQHMRRVAQKLWGIRRPQRLPWLHSAALCCGRRPLAHHGQARQGMLGPARARLKTHASTRRPQTPPMHAQAADDASMPRKTGIWRRRRRTRRHRMHTHARGGGEARE